MVSGEADLSRLRTVSEWDGWVGRPAGTLTMRHAGVAASV